MVLRFRVPVPPSVNHSHRTYTTKTGRRMRVPTKQAGDWTAQARDAAYVAAKASGWVCPCGEKVIVELTVYWPYRRRRDTNNCHKLLCDAIEGIAFDDDRWALVRDLDFDVDRDDPRVEVAVKRMTGRK